MYILCIFLNNSFQASIKNVPEFVEINYTFPSDGYSTIPYPSGYSRDNCFIVSYMSYSTNENAWSRETVTDQSICRLKADSITVYRVNSNWTKCKLVLGKYN